MASLEMRGRRYRVVFRYGGRKFQHPLKTRDQGEAASCLARVEENLRLLERGRLVPPPGADLPTFLLSDGKLAERPVVAKAFTLQTLTLSDLQGHVDRRAKEKGVHGRRLSPATMRMEMATLRAAWNRAARAGHVTGPFPNRGLKYPKTTEKPPFQTRAEIERQVARGGLTAAEQREVWGCLFLTLPEVAELYYLFLDDNSLPICPIRR
jgi:hypothetical protein